MAEGSIIARVLPGVGEIDAHAWNALWALQPHPTPFMRHEYLLALEASDSAVPDTGWAPRFMTLWEDCQLIAACPLYLKSHSYGEYVFDWAWARAYAQHGLEYYPKALIAVPFTPVPGTRLLARDAATRAALARAVRQWCETEGLSSLHLLFAAPEDLEACTADGWMQRQTVQFHWENAGYRDFDDFLASLSQEKRKKIRQERRKVTEAGVGFRALRGSDIQPADWDFFYACYERTYLEHGNPPYLQRDFFDRMAHTLPEAWLLFIAERDGRPIASSLIGLALAPEGMSPTTAYGRYWGALERVDCLHFEACYYQPLAWCIANGVDRFEGGAQGEHKMARALMPQTTTSAHWLAHPAFAEAVDNFLQRESTGVTNYLEHLQARSPFKSTP